MAESHRLRADPPSTHPRQKSPKKTGGTHAIVVAVTPKCASLLTYLLKVLAPSPAHSRIGPTHISAEARGEAVGGPAPRLL